MDPLSPIDGSFLSPSKARQASIQARDWAYVISFLSRQYAPNPIPSFERNEDTLRTLLALAAANDAADEEATLLQRAREETIANLKKTRQNAGKQPKEELLDAAESRLDDNGTRDLDDLAECAVTLGTLSADPRDIGQSIVELTAQEFDARDQLAKVEGLQKYLERELDSARAQLDRLESDKAYETSPDLPALTAEWSRSTKLLSAKIEEYYGRIASLERSRTKSPTIEELVVEEEAVKKAQETVQALEGRISMFHGLPQDPREAKLQYRQLEHELDQLTDRRNSLFAGLTKRSSPR